MNEASLASLMDHVVDNRGRTCPTVETGFPLIATNCVKSDSLYPTFEKVRYVDDLTYSNWFRGHPIPGDLIFVLKGSPGEVCMTPDPVPFCIAQDMVALRPDPEKVYPPYLFAALRSERTKNDILNMHVGTMIPHFKKGDFDRLFIPIPDRGDQRAIGDAYLTISKKIELNRRMNETLEEMARALFRDWFVDFGPTRRQIEGATDPVVIMGGAFPAEKATILASLFPAALGAIDLPEGWIKKEVGEFGRLRGGKQLPKTEFVENGAFPVFGGAGHMGNADKFNADGFVITVGRVGAYCGNFVAHRGKTWVNNNASFFDLPHSMQAEWFYLSLQALDLEPIKKGAAQPFVSNGDINALELVDPGSQVREAANDVLALLLTKAEANSKEARTLAHLRDLLLPKLMTGEIRLGAAEAAA